MNDKLLNAIDDPESKKNISLWLEGSFSEEDKTAVRNLILKSPKNAIDAFYKKLEFGTAGIRGIMGVGTNRINSFTIQTAAQGLANYMLKSGSISHALAVMIGYDSRIHSREFAEMSARVFAANGIKAYLIKHLRPTPYLSFGMRQKKCDAACMITASHNPKEYNGFKAYWNDGGQVLPPHDKGIIDEYALIKDPESIKIAPSLNHPLIVEVEEEIDADYVNTLTALQCQPDIDHKHGSDLRIVYTSLHGTGSTLLPTLFKKWGFTNLLLVDQQCVPDGNFPTVKSPNPEDKEALKLGIQELIAKDGDILIATDPDADRVGVVVKHKGSVHVLSGNQIASLLAEHLFSRLKNSENAACLKSIVTTELYRKIADHYKIQCFDILPGFKYVAEKIRLWENQKPQLKFILGAEESYGYLYGTQSRDKDALISSLLISEIALNAKLKGQTLIDTLHKLYEKYGLFLEKQHTVNFEETKEGKEAMKRAMEKIAAHYPLTLHNRKAVKVGDLRKSKFYNLAEQTEENIPLPKTDMIILRYEEGQSLMIRPSGTEPKIKIYLSLEKPLTQPIEKAIESAELESAAIFEELSQFLKN